MARKNRLVDSVIPYFIVGAIVGACAGLLAHTVFENAPASRFEGRVMLFRLPGNDTFRAARDYLSIAVSRPEFVESFAKNYDIDSATRKLISGNLTVVARDASSPNAELRLTGPDEDKLATTLDSLAIYLTESLRTIDENVMQKLLDELEKEITIATENNLVLRDSRSEYASIPEPLRKAIDDSMTLSTERKELELSLKYVLKPLSDADTKAIRQQLTKVTSAQQEYHRRAQEIAERHAVNFKLLSDIASTEATLQALRRTKQHLVIDYNKDTPLRIASRAKVTPLEYVPTSPGRSIGIGAFIGAIIGGVICSLLRSRDSKLDALGIERRLGVPTFAVISQHVTNTGIDNGIPLARSNPASENLAGIRSLNIALHLLNAERGNKYPIVITEIGAENHAPYVIANLALDMANNGMRVLVVETEDKKNQLSDLMRRGIEQSWVIALNEQDSTVTRQSDESLKHGQVYYLLAPGSAPPLVDIPQFDKVLIHAPNPAAAKSCVAAYPQSLGLVLCTATTRVSTLRKALGRALGKKLHGVVFCGAPS